MTPTATLLLGAALGIAAGSLLVPLTRRELAAAVHRAASLTADAPAAIEDSAPPRVTTRHWLALAAVSGLLPAYVLHQVGWSPNALPPLLLLIGLIQLAYCDLTRQLLPKTLVYTLSLVVMASGVVVAAGTGEWHRLFVAALGALAAFGLFFAVNLMNPRWMAFGDVRLSLGLRLRPGLGQPDGTLPGLPLRQPSGSRRRCRSDRPAPSRSQVSDALRPLHGTRRRTGPAPLELDETACCRRRHRTLTLCASSPFRPDPMVNSTVDPGSMPLRASPWTCEWWTKRSSPPRCSTNP